MNLFRIRRNANLRDDSMKTSKNAEPVQPSEGLAAGPELPHERDEKSGMTDGVPSELVQQGARDLQRGLQDTSGSPESDAAYRKLKK